MEKDGCVEFYNQAILKVGRVTIWLHFKNENNNIVKSYTREANDTKRIQVHKSKIHTMATKRNNIKDERKTTVKHNI